MGILARRKLLSAFLLFTIIFSFRPAYAQAELELYEQKIKVGLVYNFLKYTTWPNVSASGKIALCLLGDDDSFDGYLSPLEGKIAQQYEINIFHVDEVEETKNCDLLFIHRSEQGALPELLTALKGQTILTVSDIKSFSRQGGMVELAIENQRVVLYINKPAVGRAGLSIQDRLLKLAKMVER